MRKDLGSWVPLATMPTSVPPRSTWGAAHSTPPSPASSDDDEEDERESQASHFHPKEQEEEDLTSAGIPDSLKKYRAEHITDSSREDLSSMENTLSPWEEWFLCKERKLRARLHAQAMAAMRQEMEKMKEKQERERKKVIAAQKHREWVQKKNEEVKRERKERERKISKEMAEKAAKELEKAQSKDKAREVYQEWLKKKKKEEVQKKKEEKEKERQQEAELQEKKEKSEKMFKEWLQNSRNKGRPASAVYSYTSVKSTGIPDGSVYPVPTFYNPIPWKPSHVPTPKEEKYVSMKKNKRPIPSHTYRSSSVHFHKSKNNLYIGPLCRIQR
ncbi:coiled-coil domain-containing protein 34 isoform X2 [Sceloporus undulatus]|uniref:coiled-coil domain-containing protein 34 isoform X2 n=1 Tax=Sceloporus undulatus TaxID=8520 RepID=UPI001C4A84B9|nr:coiled-coil domain-containing protein 34 isoform X2 [Sceloporus undulatus]